MRPIWGKPALEISVDGERWVVVADLHIGFEVELTMQGVYIPDQSDRILSKLLELSNVDGLLIAGDLKHYIGPHPSQRVRDFVEKLSKSFKSLELVQGNHDGGLPKFSDTIRIYGTRGKPLGEAWIFHGHAYPPEESASYEFGVMGHVHPSISLRGLGRIPVWVVGDSICDGLPQTVIIMPAFNDMVGYGDIVNPNESGPIFPNCFDPDSTDVLTLEGDYLGTLSFLSSDAKLIY